MEPRRRLVEAEDADRGLLIAQLPKVVAENEGDRLGGIAVAAMLAADRDTVGKGPNPSVTIVSGEIADYLARRVLDHKAEGIPFGFPRRLLLRPLTHRLRGLWKRDVGDATRLLVVLVPGEIDSPVGRLDGAQSHALAVPDRCVGIHGRLI